MSFLNLEGKRFLVLGVANRKSVAWASPKSRSFTKPARGDSVPRFFLFFFEFCVGVKNDSTDDSSPKSKSNQLDCFCGHRAPPRLDEASPIPPLSVSSHFKIESNAALTELRNSFDFEALRDLSRGFLSTGR